jgi:glutaconyl-CoA/methylmalonyl-CoA decarboxylase subunit gamma
VLRRFSVKLGGKERIVELGLGDDGRQRVVVDGLERSFELSAVEDGAWLVRDGVAQTLAYVDGHGDGGKVSVSMRRPGADPVVIAAEVVEARSAAVAALVGQAQRAGGTGPSTVKSPMPGRLVKILVRAGERITAGQPVVVVEAMKMENELRAPRAGTVREIRCAEGAAVEAGQDLVVIEPAG